jgi:2-polyprenyl-3-methyl-5-hydroxy-6-metoxy-1,4-benzoquinol methylase
MPSTRATCCNQTLDVLMKRTAQLDSDDWDQHWAAFGDAVSGNPATSYRSRLILKFLGNVDFGAEILEIGCGQGELTLLLAETFPEAVVRGIDISAEVVARATRAARARGLSARFAQRDLLQTLESGHDDRGRAAIAVCSEVLEHVDRPDVLLRNATDYLATGCRLVVTVPGGPRSAFDRHIGHRRHFTADSLRRLLEENGFEDVTVHRAGFPFFNVYRLVVIARGKKLIADVEQSNDPLSDGTSGAVLRLFDRVFRYNLDSSRFGWQLLAVARRSEHPVS